MMAKIFFALLFILVSTPTIAKSIVVLGDSISASYGMDINKGWVALIQQKLDQENTSYTIFNESISGDTTAGGLARIDKILTQYNPQLLILELGANDGLRGLSLKEMKKNLATIIRRSQQADTKVLLLSMRIPPNYGKRYITLFYDIYPQLAKELKIPFVPFILEDVALIKEMMQKDGLHPNDKAQPVIANKIWQYLLSVLEL